MSSDWDVKGPYRTGRRSLVRLQAETVGALIFSGLVCIFAFLLGSKPGGIFDQSLLANLRPHICIIIVLCGLLASMLGAWIRGAAITFAGLAAIAFLLAQVRFAEPPPQGPTHGESLRVVHFNALIDNPNGHAISRMLREQDADIVTIAEAKPLQPHLQRLSDLYPHQFGCSAESCDLLLLSKRPLVNPHFRWFPLHPKRFIAARINLENVQMRVYAAHWTKSFFSVIRTREVNALIDNIKREETPALLMGDFNATQWDPGLKRLSDAHDLRHPNSYISTWPADLGRFGLQIDHILATPEFAFNSIAPLPSAHGSNHRGLIAEVVLR